ncbi:MAG: nitroreductase family protein [Prevotellaceae bacterium]|nr:nitroreductase family protein [Prevotellaceae bacterium]MDY3855595.1 nitroreductase family protein [Bacteroidaceae bacterium]
MTTEGLTTPTMTLTEAIRVRHSVRRYLDKPIEPEKVALINRLIGEYNRESGLHIQLVSDEPLAFSTGIFKYGSFSNVRNYLALVGPKGSGCKEAVGYYGERLVLYMQTLGLNSCWVALTYRNIKDAYRLSDGEQLKLVVACGYGATAGHPHPQRKGAGAYYSDGRATGQPLPDWFVRGMEAALLAPTAVNQQKFHFTLLPDDRVKAESRFSVYGNTAYDLGIVKCHFELAAGKDHFRWADRACPIVPPHKGRENRPELNL